MRNYSGLSEQDYDQPDTFEIEIYDENDSSGISVLAVVLGTTRFETQPES